MNFSKFIIIFIVFFFVIIFYVNNNYAGSPCYNCHQIFKETCNKPYIHSPVKEETCDVCHESHGNTNQLVLKSSIHEICFQCHDDKSKEIIKAHFGRHIISDNCIKCHDPHASQNKKLLHSFAHIPFKKGKCFECHSKSLDSTRFVLPKIQLCRKCHIDKTKSISKIFYHKPYLQGECTSCHTPHTTDNIYQLKTSVEQICTNQCHDNIRYKHKPTSPIKLQKCLVCHVPHFSFMRFLIRQKVKG